MRCPFLVHGTRDVQQCEKSPTGVIDNVKSTKDKTQKTA